MGLEVTHLENRGDSEVPYGFVYFNDGHRLGYAPTDSRNEEWYGLFPVLGEPATLPYFSCAVQWLFEHFPAQNEFFPRQAIIEQSKRILRTRSRTFQPG